MKWGFLGYGRIARKFEESLGHTDHEIAAVASRSGSQTLIDRDFKVYDNYDDLINDPDIDIIYVNTTHNTHARYTIQSLDAGKHVLCEKPLGISTMEVSQMIEAARRNRRFLMEAIWSRFLPGYRKAIDLINEGVIGRPRFVSVHFGFKMNPKDPKERLIDPALAAGAIWDVGIYPISLAQDVYKQEPVIESVIAELSPRGVEDRCCMQFSYDGAVAQLSCGINMNTPNYAMISGTKGYIVMEDFWKCERFTLHYASGKPKEYNLPMTSTGLYHEAVAVVDYIRSGLLQSPYMTWEQSLQLARVMDQSIALARNNNSEIT